MSHKLIATQERIDEVCRHLAGEDAIGVDTEFLRVRTYYPKLALVQISTRDAIYCIDPLIEGLDLDGLWSMFADPAICKVMHAARQDVEVLLHAAGLMPGPLFDTQIAAALLGYQEQTGYAALVEAEFGVKLPKVAQRTDWTRRPLSDAQFGYAENDVRYLLPLHDRLRGRLDSLERLEWALEDSARILDPDLYRADPEQAYRRVGKGARLERRAQHALQRLCAWREQAARRRDLPRSWVLDDETLAAIATASPPTREDLLHVEGIGREVVRRDGDAIVACVNEPATTAEALWSRREGFTDQQKALRTALIQRLKSLAGELGVAQSVLLTRSDLDRLVRGERPEAVVQGWRREVVGRALQAVPQGNSTASGVGAEESS